LQKISGLGIIKINTIRVYAHHGCLEEEGVVGSAYEVDIAVEANLAHPAESDHLSDTVDYVHLHRIVTEEMNLRSKLLEHVAQRIITRVLMEIIQVESVEVTVSKINPPIGGDVASVSVQLSGHRP
jgi:dihydroneopterin aldolase